MENIDNMDWEAITPPENSDEEIKNIQKRLRQRDRKTILTSLVLVVALLLSTFYIAMPLAETLYWSPWASTLDTYTTDLKLVLQAYTELFLPGKTISVLPGKVGFADYELHITMYDPVRDTVQHLMGSLRKGKLGFDMEMFDNKASALFTSTQFPDTYPESLIRKENEKARARLEELPEYIRLEAAVTFPEDLTMAELLKIMEYDYIGSQGDLKVVWAAIRTWAPNPDSAPKTVGISFTLSPIDGGINEAYPEFMLSCYEPTGTTLEEHFKSLIRFSNDMMLDGKCVITWHESNNFYEQALAYVEENGVKAYGCIVTGTPQTLLALLDSGDILDMELMDAWIDVG